MAYIIKDWADNEPFPLQSFPTFDDAWEYIYEQSHITEEDYEEFVVINRSSQDAR